MVSKSADNRCSPFLLLIRVPDIHEAGEDEVPLRPVELTGEHRHSHTVVSVNLNFYSDAEGERVSLCGSAG